MTIIYIYQAALYCEACGARIRADLTAQGKAPADPDDQASYDSDKFPKDQVAGETDSAGFCDSGVLSSGHKIGCYLEEDLTSEGIKNLQESLSRADLDPVLRRLYKDIADAHNVEYLTEDQIKELRVQSRWPTAMNAKLPAVQTTKASLACRKNVKFLSPMPTMKA
ncbi:MAG: hypothetical protein E6Q36_01235 [Chryseobacterium sp.]|nr:MAG: hypothetical protein E6Q36_01235 [Chryseobacterium sp.]